MAFDVLPFHKTLQKTMPLLVATMLIALYLFVLWALFFSHRQQSVLWQLEHCSATPWLI